MMTFKRDVFVCDCHGQEYATFEAARKCERSCDHDSAILKLECECIDVPVYPAWSREIRVKRKDTDNFAIYKFEKAICND